MAEQNIHPGKIHLLLRSLKEQSFLKRIIPSLKERGLMATLQSSLSLLEYVFDMKYGTDTMTWVHKDDLDVDEDVKRHAVLYQPSRTVPLRHLFKTLRLPEGKVFVDLGCGKGKVLFIAAEFGFKEVRGIEVSPLLCAIARMNIDRFMKKNKTSTSISVIESDVLAYPIRDDEEVFYLFNPFDAEIIQEVMNKIAASIQRQPRKIWIIYNTALHKDRIEELLKPVNIRVHSIWGQEFVVYAIGAR